MKLTMALTAVAASRVTRPAKGWLAVSGSARNTAFSLDWTSDDRLAVTAGKSTMRSMAAGSPDFSACHSWAAAIHGEAMNRAISATAATTPAAIQIVLRVIEGSAR